MYFQTFTGAFESLLSQLLLFVPKLVIAYLIWIIGRYLISWSLTLIDKLDIKGLVIDDHLRRLLKTVLAPAAKIILLFIVLDTLGIGSNVLSALVNAFTLTIAVALGLAFGRALEPEAKAIIDQARKYWKQGR